MVSTVTGVRPSLSVEPNPCCHIARSPSTSARARPGDLLLGHELGDPGLVEAHGSRVLDCPNRQGSRGAVGVLEGRFRMGGV
jgi:hypothetical protein